ncbi:MAG TPA: hypothetical protein DFR83_20805, partial [Deltaproteobacteria bacterium]|nr:hypothetical protein [Deltaproteobacteria bacterium]
MLAAGLGIPAAGCGGSDLAQEWQLDRLRVLAVRATPAEPRPGDTVTFERLLYVPPETTLETVTWFGCLPDGSIGFGCEFDPSILDAFADLDFASATPEELAELFAALEAAGFIGAEPGFAPTWQAPEDALEGLSDSQRQEGRNAIVNITAVPSENAADDTELALKRVPVSENDTPNTNPNVLGIEVEGKGFLGGSGTEEDPYLLEPRAEVQLSPTLADDAIEEYTYITTTGAIEARTEVPYWSWYTDGGQFAQNISLPPYNYATYTAPDASGWTGLIAVVMRDRRGGMG